MAATNSYQLSLPHPGGIVSQVKKTGWISDEVHSFGAVHAASCTSGLKVLKPFLRLSRFLPGRWAIKREEWMDALCAHVYSVLKSHGRASRVGRGSAVSPTMRSWHRNKISTFLPSSAFKEYLLRISTVQGLYLTLLLCITEPSTHWAQNRSLKNTCWFNRFYSTNTHRNFSVPGTVLDTGNIKTNPSDSCYSCSQWAFTLVRGWLTIKL